MTGEADVTESLRDAILAGDYVPGQRLVEADLCERFGTSRFIIRSALQLLAAQGLVEVLRNRGARVRTVSVAEAIKITEVSFTWRWSLAGRRSLFRSMRRSPEAVASGDPAAAEDAMRRHIDSVIDALRALPSPRASHHAVPATRGPGG